MKIASKLIKDGNSKAVRLPKVALDMSGISAAVDLIVKEGEIVIRNRKAVRSGWDKALLTDMPAIDNELVDWDALAGDAIE